MRRPPLFPAPVVFVDSGSGKFTSCPGLDKVLFSATEADVRMIVTELNRLTGPLENLLESSTRLRGQVERGGGHLR